MFSERIPLRKVKTMRNTFSEKNIMNNFLKEHAYILSQISSWGSNIIIHPLRSIMDVSVLGGAPSIPWCSSLALRLIWGCHVGCWGWGSCKRQKNWATGSPHRGESTIILNSWSWWLGPEITRWQVNIHFCVKDVSLVWERLFFLSKKQWWPTSVLLPGKTQGWRGLVGCSSCGH